MPERIFPIKKSIEDFLKSSDYRAHILNDFLLDIYSFMKKEDSFPDIAIIGGFPRDIAYKGISSFSSDIDIIIDCSKESLEKYSEVNKTYFKNGKIEKVDIIFID